MKTPLAVAALSSLIVAFATEAFAGDDLICKKIDKDAFWDVMKDACYVCPKGFKHQNRGVDDGACFTELNKKGIATGGKGPVCVTPAFVSMHDNKPFGVCMKCPKTPERKYDKAGNVTRWSGGGGFIHDHTKLGNEPGVCHAQRYATPKKLASDVTAKPVKAALCEATMKTFKAGASLPKGMKLPDIAAALKAANLTADKVKDSLKAYKSEELDGVADVLTKVKAVADKFETAKKELFNDPHVICTPSLAASKLKELGLVPPGWDSDSYLAFTFTFGLGAGIGGQGAYTLVTNFDDPPFLLGSLGVTTSTDSGYSISAGVQYFPEVGDPKAFLGASLGGSAGIGVGVLGAGVDLSFDASKTGADVIQGIGPHASVGVGGSALVVGSIGFSLTQSWDMAAPPPTP